MFSIKQTEVANVDFIVQVSNQAGPCGSGTEAPVDKKAHISGTWGDKDDDVSLWEPFLNEPKAPHLRH